MKKYSTIEKNGRTYYRDQFTHNGKQYFVYAKTVNELKAKLSEKQKQLYTDVIDSDTTVEKWADEWLETYKKPYIVTKSYNNYRTVIDKYIVPNIGPIKLSDVKHVQLQAILNKYTMSKSYLNMIKNALTGMFSAACLNNLINRDPSAGLKIPKAATQGKRRSLTEAEQAALLKVCETHYAGVYCLLIYYCGLRPGEAAALDWEDIDLKKKIIHITKAVESGSKTIKTPKTAAGVRDVPIPKPLLDRLKREKGQGRVLLNPTTGTTVDVVDLDRWFRNIRRYIDIELGATVYRNQITESKIEEPFNSYCLRHTYCTNLQKAGVQLNVAKYLMGHESITITAQIYTHQTEDQTDAARDLMNNFFA